MSKNTLDISWETILKVVVAVVALYFLYLIFELLVFFLFALVISMLFNPAIDFFRRFRIPRSVAVVGTYFGFFSLLSFLIYLVVPIFAREVKEFSLLVPEYFDKMSPIMQRVGVQVFESTDSIFDILTESSEIIAANALNALVVIFGGVFTAFFVITMAIFLSLEGNAVEKTIGVIVPSNRKERALSLWKRCRDQVHRWFLTRILACLFVGICSYFVFLFFNVSYPVFFALIAGVFNLIPFVGPAVSGAIFFVVISLDSFTKATFATAAFAVVQIIESEVMIPLLSKRFMGVSPVLVLVAVVIGGFLWGILGAFLAIPFLAILFEFFKEYMQKKN